jgi:hypothetical protein
MSRSWDHAVFTAELGAASIDDQRTGGLGAKCGLRLHPLESRAGGVEQLADRMSFLHS